MTTERQIAANRENAKKSTGPRTQDGKRRSRRNALRHGLTSVIEALEDPADYRALARAINADYRPATNFERELMARLVSLLWRLRRVSAIESGLLGLHADMRSRTGQLDIFYKMLDPALPDIDDVAPAPIPHRDKTKFARSYLALTTSDGAAFERLGRYESRLWRQLAQTILVLNTGTPRTRPFTAYERRYMRSGIQRNNDFVWPPHAAPAD